MMGPRRFVLVRGVDSWESAATSRDPARAAKGPLERLLEYSAAPTPTTTLVLVAGKLDGRRRLVSTAKSGNWLVSCQALSRRALPAWIERRAQELSSRLAPGVADLIAELAGPELSAVSDALERVCLYVGPEGTVTEDDVATCVTPVRTATVWQLVSAVGRRDIGAALAALEEVYDPQDRGLRLVGVLAWSTRQLLKFESATRAGLKPADAAKRAGAPPFKARELAEQVRDLPREHLERWLERLARVDLDLKGGSRRAPKAILEHALIELCRGGRTTARRSAPSRRLDPQDGSHHVRSR
jgi:DNA polymerase-3 subunit delta